ncbi:bifunctional oligoribonuclease/PAP phosphatase NrnA [Niallia circulans]|jgi:bifunctional oligoribonuclease and PAP phosphatase NrnA|uniref:DHH family phosphoesterase n=1 Tax=Niallia TaxID=2837506 RepID=UPI00077C49DD|nr:bifunctional oligoribonuclease/PAP phosphatase NrnA [Niallia circulans]MCM2982894.1 bifunctional oligoribonuclease/PAP phosphatase NrnA [Niallia circulans]MDR4317278.1 bifunctional oligoribonuclease/PAP phosphatase NrnA [Niallia circulans]MED3838769.1 bifunctional oligoribonuclease/PAP phosphatase NrnA [Niallia circulans]MED4245165.1 bifunctional oligoribonuclease/PAP phosphatase NrnA [Niallia circulans]MED4248686.1 bifunctional oligoribonuclease/PAP phosphatase NrnA [Niallia circulans]
MKQKILDAIRAFNTIIIHRHVRPDPDAYGSQGGLAEIIKTSYPDKNVYTVGKEEASLNFLRRLDVIDDSTYADALVIVCDTANQERVCDQRYLTGKMLIKIDHHPNDDAYGDIVWVETAASSTSELIYEFYLFGEDQGLKMSDEAARLLYAGIVGDTGRFLYPSTSEKTFLYAGELIKYSFSRTEMYDQMYELDPHIVKLSGYVLQNFQVHANGVASMKLNKEILAQFQATPAEASLLVSSLGSVKGLKAWVFFIEEADQIRVRLRSKGPVINGIAKKYNGGGHPMASGATIYQWEDACKVVKDLEAVCK